MIFGSTPVIIVGAILYQTNLISYLRNIEIIAWTTLIFAILLYFADKFKVNKKLNTKLDLKTILVIGCFQILALIPGVSRSGIVITAGRFLKFDRYDSTKISFYLSIPVIAGASFLGFKDLYKETTDFNSMILLTVLLSYFFSYFTIKYFLIFVKRFDLKLFVIYRVLLSVLLFNVIYSLEGVFAAIAGWIILDQFLNFNNIIGCFLILFAVILSQILPTSKINNIE